MVFFFPSFLSKTFFAPLCSSPSSPPPLPPSPSSSSSGNGRLLGRSKRRNCLRVQSSKKASSIWRDRVRRARRPLPCPPAAAAAAPASCRRDPEPRPAGVSRRERTHTHTHARRSRTHPHAPSLPGPQLLGPGLLCCSRGRRSPVLCVPGCHCAGCVSVRHRAVWLSLRPPRPRAPAHPSQEPAAPEVSHVAEVCFLFIKSCVYLLVWGGEGAGGGRRPGDTEEAPAGGWWGRAGGGSGSQRSARGLRRGAAAEACGGVPGGRLQARGRRILFRAGAVWTVVPGSFPVEEGPGQPPKLPRRLTPVSGSQRGALGRNPQGVGKYTAPPHTHLAS